MWKVSGLSLIILNELFLLLPNPTQLTVSEREGQAGWAAELSGIYNANTLFDVTTDRPVTTQGTPGHSLFLSSSKSRDKCYCVEGLGDCQQWNGGDNNQNKPVSKNSNRQMMSIDVKMTNRISTTSPLRHQKPSQICSLKSGVIPDKWDLGSPVSLVTIDKYLDWKYITSPLQGPLPLALVRR